MPVDQRSHLFFRYDAQTTGVHGVTDRAHGPGVLAVRVPAAFVVKAPCR